MHVYFIVTGAVLCGAFALAPLCPADTHQDEYEAVFPAVQTRGISITTRVTATRQVLSSGCDHFSSVNCTYNDVESESYYIGDIAFFTVREM